MSANFDRSETAEIVDMQTLLENPSRRRINVSRDGRRSAVLLSIRQNLSFRATVSINDLDVLKSHFDIDVVDRLSARVRQLLDAEFGSLRVHRSKQVFVVGHHCAEELIAGLLRVQYHARLVDVPRLPDGRLFKEAPGLTLHWGIGESLIEADMERDRRRRERR